MLHDKAWVGLLAWLGILLLPALFASLWLPDLAERWSHRRWHPLRRIGFALELLVRVGFAFAARVLRLDRTGAHRG